MRRDADTETPTQTEHSIDLAFDFLRGAMERPEIVDELPDGARLDLRQIDVAGHVLTLVATPNKTDGAWEARIARYTVTGGARAFLRPVLDRRSVAHDQLAMMRTMTAAGATADEALDRLATEVRTAIEEAVRVDLDEINRRHTS